MAQAGTLNSAAFNAVIAEARSRDLLVSFGDAPSEVPWKYLHIAGRPCQVSRTSLIHTSQDYVEATSLPIYLPRTSFADFVIYVPTRTHGICWQEVKSNPRRNFARPYG